MGVSPKSRLRLWTQASGNCQFAGCNTPLLGDLVSGRTSLNKAYVAHIIAETPGGPRGDPILSPLLVDDVANLMLLCDPHHRLVDGPDAVDFPVERLKAMKAAHETRIQRVIAVSDHEATHVVLFGARIGAHDTPVRFDLAQRALSGRRWAAEARAIHLDLAGVALQDHEPGYWEMQVENLRRAFETVLRPRLARGEIGHVSLFALAPQPLLILAGSLFGDVTPVTVHQLHREPPGWDWRTERPPVRFDVVEPVQDAGPVVLKLGLSATLADDRIPAALGPEPAVWSITTPNPHNDLMHREDDLAAFRRTLRTTLDRIKARHGEAAVIHVLPALPVSAAVELGRCWMPKADLSLRIYDQCRVSGGFVHRLDIVQPAEPPVRRQTLELAYG